MVEEASSSRGRRSKGSWFFGPGGSKDPPIFEEPSPYSKKSEPPPSSVRSSSGHVVAGRDADRSVRRVMGRSRSLDRSSNRKTGLNIHLSILKPENIIGRSPGGARRNDGVGRRQSERNADGSVRQEDIRTSYHPYSRKQPS